MAVADPPLTAPLLDTALAHVTRSVPTFRPTERAGQVRAAMAGQRYESADDVAVVEGDRLLGLLPIEDLLAAEPDAPIAELMDPDPPVVAPGVDQEVAAWRMVHHHEVSLAVVDASGRFLGLVPPVRMMAVLLEEHEEDVSRLSGVMHETRSARAATTEPVARRFWHRLPWLLVGLAGAVLAAGIVGSFEDDIAERVELAFFLPGVVYLADAVGTQTEAVIIRGLSVGVSIRSIVWRETWTGFLIGAAIAAAFVPAALLLWGDLEVAVAVALALFAASSVATLVAMTLPALLDRLGADPAFGSGPLATVVQDLLSIVLYFAIVVGITA